MAQSFPQSRELSFAQDVQPILANHCYPCHGPDPQNRMADLRLDDPTQWSAELQSGEGAAITPGDVENSRLMQRVRADDDAKMPPHDFNKPLSPAQIEILRNWIQTGAPWEQHWAYAQLTPVKIPSGNSQTHTNKQAFPNWQEQAIDRFIFDALQHRPVQPSPPADPITLMRRLHFDLIGLPPSPAIVDAFVADPSPTHYAQIVDQLLASHAHAEQMTRHWLDWVRFADTVGYHGDQEHPVWPYRDYVVKSFLDNKALDVFSIEQLAGDLLDDHSLDGASQDPQIATAYLRLLQTTHEGGAQDGEYLAKYLSDRVRNFSEVWLGSTLGCAECHDHKFDPWTQKDFYQLGAFFADIEERGSYDGISPNRTPTTRPPQIEVISPLDRHRLPQDFEQQVEAAVATNLPAAWQAALDAKLKQAANTNPNPNPKQDLENDSPTVAKLPTELSPAEQQQVRLRVTDQTRQRLWQQYQVRSGQCMITRATTPREIRVLPRGDWMDESGERVLPATPAALPPLPSDIVASHRSAGETDLGDRGGSARRANRLDLAKWLFQDDNPLPARVFANRIWAIAMGRGLSRSLGDVGRQGQWPTHPELLDYLAWRLRSSAWNSRALLREIVLSQTYQQSSQVSAEAFTADPLNDAFARQNRFRLPAETIRDSALWASQLLDETLGGPSVKPYQPPGYYQSLNFPEREYISSQGSDLYRRGLYMHWQRQFLHPMLKAFDAPSREECTVERNQSNTPAAALVLLNDPSFVEAARALALSALRLPIENGVSPEAESVEESRVQFMFNRVTSRQADATELSVLRELLATQTVAAQDTPSSALEILNTATPLSREALDAENIDAVQLAVWTQVARVLLNLDEAITRY